MRYRDPCGLRRYVSPLHRFLQSAATSSTTYPSPGRISTAQSQSVTHTIIPKVRPDLPIILSTNRLARLALSSVSLTAGPTTLLATLCGKPREESDESISKGLIPLTVDYREKAAAQGVIPGSWWRREGQPSSVEIGVGRLVDRIIRGGMVVRDDIGKWDALQLVVTVLSGARRMSGMEVGMEGLAVNAGIAAGVLGGVLNAGGCGVIGRMDQREWKAWEGQGGRCVIGVGGGEGVVGMAVDGEMMRENEIGSAMDKALGLAKEMRTGIAEFARKVESVRMLEGRGDFPRLYPKRRRIEKLKKEDEDNGPRKAEWLQQLEKTATELVTECFEGCGKFSGKSHRAFHITNGAVRFYDAVNDLYSDDLSQLPSDEVLNNILQRAWRIVFRNSVLRGRRRLDGRTQHEVRPLRCQEAVLPGAVHGSGLFERGDTQVLATTAIGLPHQSQRFDAYIQEETKKFMVHYTFPPFATGDVSFFRAPNRREVGHSDLVERALRHAIPEDYPYAVRVTCETLASDGSTSMAAVSATSVALIDAGVPLKYPVVGVAMGAVVDDDRGEDGMEAVCLTDILGAEDHFGDMDMKVCGTREGVTAIQMDAKRPEGIGLDIIKQALMRAKRARGIILDTVEPELNSKQQGKSGCTDNVFTDVDGDGHEEGEEVCKPEIRIFSVTRATVKALLSDRAFLLKELEASSNTRLTLLPQGRPTTMRVESVGSSGMKQVIETLGKIEMQNVRSAHAF